MRHLAARAGALCLAGLGLSGCDSITHVEAPDIIDPTSLESPQGALALRAGAQRRFAELLGNASTLSIVMTSGLVADELISGETTLRSDVDARREVEFSLTSLWPVVGIARRTALDAIPYMLRYQPGQAARTGELYALAGLIETLVGENFCSGATLSRAVDGQPIYGGSLTTMQFFDTALVHLDSAVTLAADSARLLNLARVARGRTLVNLGRFDEAAATVAAVPTGFVYNAEFSTGAQQNRTFVTPLFIGVADVQGGNGLDFQSAADPRVPTTLQNTGDDGVTPMYRYLPYASTASPIPVATGREARLIQAEAALRNGDTVAWLDTLNALRAGFTPPLGVLSDPGTADARINVMFRERAFWLFLTAHRLGDLRRLIRQYGRARESVFPTGTYKDGLPFSTATYVALPVEERFNPNFTGCDSAAP